MKMKKQILCTGLLLCILSGCTNNKSSSSNDTIGIYSWMFSDSLTIKQATEKIGQPSKNDSKDLDEIQYVWNDYQLCNNYKGTLILNYNENETDYFSTNKDRSDYEWRWTINNCNDSDYTTIINVLTQECKDVQQPNQVEDNECINFITDIQDKNYCSDLYTPNFTILTVYNPEKTLSIVWGKTRIDPDHFNSLNK